MFQIVVGYSVFRFWNICTYKHEILWGRDPSLNMKYIYVFYTPYIPCLKVCYALILVHLHFDCNKSSEVRCRIFHLWYYVAAQNILNFSFQIFRSGMINLHWQICHKESFGLLWPDLLRKSRVGIPGDRTDYVVYMMPVC